MNAKHKIASAEVLREVADRHATSPAACGALGWRPEAGHDGHEVRDVVAVDAVFGAAMT
jgi:hypothetical protein